MSTMNGYSKQYNTPTVHPLTYSMLLYYIHYICALHNATHVILYLIGLKDEWMDYFRIYSYVASYIRITSLELNKKLTS